MSVAEKSTPLAVDVVSDVVCPWCYLGKRRLEAAAEMAGVPLEITWRPYQLDATIPAGGLDRAEYMQTKFGDSGRIEEAHRRLVALGAEVGISYAFDLIELTPNTLDAHRVIRWSGHGAIQDRVVEALFHAYFVEGRDIGNRGVLADIAAEAGLQRDVVAAKLETDDDCAEVQADITGAQRIGVTGVPTFVLAARFGLVGAQSAETLADAIRQAASGNLNASEETNAPPG